MQAQYDWQRQRRREAFLALQDGSIYRGYAAGAATDTLGEVVFNTGMTGYQEILSDPSYHGQLVVMTCPEIGNYGMNAADMESRRLFANGFVTHAMNEPSNWRAEQSLDDALRLAGIPALAGIDTRALTTHLRRNGTQRGFISVTGRTKEAEAVSRAREWSGLDGQDYAARVTCAETYDWDPENRLSRFWDLDDALPEADLRVVAFDFGIKWNILRCLRQAGMRVAVVPASTTAEAVLEMRPDGVFLSNGPADPAAVTYAIESARALIGKVPLMGICLGHQLLGLACGGRTERLKFGHHGCNHPVKNLVSGAVEITSQNHNFTLQPESLRDTPLEITHINLNDRTVEGIAHKTEPMFAVQYHPEAGPGPHDPAYLFQRFREMITSK
ncbi:MAG: glutamine-hydrolyzing carbamoyl-phosphate synthase small subunit [Kiritimatiellia bacterium]